MAAATGDDRSVRSGRKIPYLLLLPGMAFTFVFFVVPLITLLKISLSSKPEPLIPNYDFTWEWSNFSTAFTEFGSQLLRSFIYAGIATLLCLLIAYPIAYFIAFKAGQWRNILLGLVMVPFFTSFLLRTIAWQSLLSDHGPVLGVVSWFDWAHLETFLNKPIATLSKKAAVVTLAEAPGMKLLPPREWTRFAHRLIHHGRRVCFARKPRCSGCALLRWCPQIGVADAG